MCRRTASTAEHQSLFRGGLRALANCPAIDRPYRGATTVLADYVRSHLHISRGHLQVPGLLDEGGTFRDELPRRGG